MNTSIRNFNTVAISYVAAALLSGFAAAAVADEVIDVGKLEYRASCASCHGVAGKGDGPVMAELKHPAANLTVLAKNNSGVFPFDRVYQIIDGRQEVKAHGPREMPVWGHGFNLQCSAYFENYPAEDTESNARSRILALTEYLYRLQEK